MPWVNSHKFFKILRIGVLIKVILLIGIADNTIAQPQWKKITIKGRVTDEELYPIANATIVVDGRSTDKVTNHHGKYRIRVLNDAKKIGILNFGNSIVEEDIFGSRPRINFILDTEGVNDVEIR